MALSAGTYQASVRLYDPGRTGDYSIQLSSDDTASPAPQIPTLIVDDPALDAEIATDQESDLYQINIATTGRYLIETHGTTDVRLSLLGPNNQTSLIASDDDSGVGLNSRLTLELNPGLYYANVRHYSTFGRGAYQIRITNI
jgi:tyrosinase